MRKIAEKIEYSPTTIYLHFQDKVDLLDCICEETLLRLEERLVAIRKTFPAPLEKMRRGLQAYIAFGVEHPSDYQVAFMMEFKNMVENGRHLRCHEIGHRVYEAFRHDVGECIEQGLFARRDVDAVSQAIWASIHGMAALQITRPRFPWVDQRLLCDTLVDSVIAGFKHEDHHRAVSNQVCGADPANHG